MDAEKLWIMLFIVLAVLFIVYSGVTYYRQKSKTKHIEDKMSTVLNRVKDGVVAFDYDWRYTYVNEAMLENSGKKKSELIGHVIWDVFPEQRNTAFWDKLHEVARNRQKGELEVFSKRMNKWFDVKVFPASDGITLTYTEITDRKKVEEQQSLMASIINSSEDAILSLTMDGICTSWNKGAENIFGYSKEEIVGESIQLIIPPELQNELDQVMQKVKTGERVQSYETERIRKDGQRIKVSLSVSPIVDFDGNFVGTSAIVRDITELKKIAKKLSDSEKLFSDAFHKSPAGMTIYRLTDGIILDANSSFCKMSEYSREELIGRRPVELNLVSSIESEKLRQKQLEDGDLDNFEVTIYSKSRKPINILFSTSQMKFNNEPCMITSFIDISRQKNAEISLIQVNESLQNQTKELTRSNAELEQFAYVASHDMQEPLRMISSFLTQLEKKYGDVLDEKGKTYIGFAVDGAKRMRQIILDLLEFSRVGKTEDKKEELDINNLISEIRILFRKQIEDKSATIKATELPLISTYRIPLYQIFRNLISNALTYAAQQRPCTIEISAAELETHWQFNIADNGIGINEEFFDRIFIIFQRLHNKEDYPGTGMGLAITKKIVESLGGKIWVSSVEGKGSTFHFTIKK